MGRRTHRTPVLAITVVAIVALAGCAPAPADPSPPAGMDLGSFDTSEGNGLWLVSGPEIADEVLAAVRSAGAVHVTGSFTETNQPDPEADPVRGRTLAVDYTGHAGAFVAEVSAGGSVARILVDAGTARVRGNAAYAAAIGAPEAADAVACTVGTDPVLAQWSPVLDPADLVAALLDAGPLSVEEPVGDAEVLEVVIGESAPIGVLAVARHGAPLPLSFTAADTTGDASFSFADWGVDPDLDAAAAELACPTG